jgi:GntR family transcriptional regulator
VRDLIRSAIVHREIEDGLLPSESELMLAFSASRQVVRDALDLLRGEGLVQRVPGNGTFVLAAKVQHRFDHLHGPYTRRKVSHRVLAMSEERAPKRVAEALELGPHPVCGVVDYVTFLDDESYYFCTVYVPESLIGIVEQASAVDEWYSLYERAGIQLGVTDVWMEATLADEHVAEHLRIREGSPLMLFERLVRDKNGVPLEYAFARTRGDRISIHIQTPRQPRRPTTEAGA